MPAITNFSSQVTANLLSISESALLEWAQNTLTTEPQWTGGSGQTTAFEKRIALANEIILTNGKKHSRQLASFLLYINPSIVVDQKDKFEDICMQNNNALQSEIIFANGYNARNYDSRIAISDVLAGVNQKDMI